MSTSLARRLPLLSFLLVRPRLCGSTTAGVAAGCLVPGIHDPVTRLLVGWNTATCLYLVLAVVMMARATQARLRWRATIEYDGRYVILIGTVLAAIAALLAIGAQLGQAKELSGWPRAAHLGLAGLTVVTSWAFIQTIFALHYAHDYYLDDEGRGNGDARGGLLFPGEDQPDYLDFLYFACVIGTSGQTADVAFTASRMRRLGMLHCVLAFFFNATLLALTINIAASLL